MKYVFTLALSFLFISIVQSCRTPKEQAPVADSETTIDHGSAPSTSDRITGIVRVSDECGVSIEVIQGDVMRSFYPVNLDERYRVEGMRLKFAWEEGKAKAPEACPNYEPVKLSDVTPLR